MKFWDREKEAIFLRRYIESEPNAILFVYGPKSSGKSTLLMHVAKQLRGGSRRFIWYDLRKYAIESMNDAISILLGAKGHPTALAKLFDINLFFITIKPDEMMKFMKKERDPFVLIETELVKLKEKGETPVIVFDEIQNLKEIYLNGERRLIDRLFNFFVAVTKVNHLSHVLVMTSDTFFIEEIYQSSALENTSRYFLVDFFDDETTYKILKDEGLSDEEARYVVENVGGVPWMMEQILNGDVKSMVEELCVSVKNSIKNKLTVEYKKSEKLYNTEVEFLRRLVESNGMGLRKEDREVVERLVQLEILYYDPINDRITPHTKLHGKAIKKLLESLDRV